MTININHQGILSLGKGRSRDIKTEGQPSAPLFSAGEEKYGHYTNKLLKMESNVTEVITFDSHKWTYSIFNVYSVVHTLLLLMADCVGEN